MAALGQYEWFDKCQSCGHRRGEHIPYGPGCRAFVSACICPSRASNLGACPIHDGRGNVRGEAVKTAPVSEGRLAADRGESLSGFPHVSGMARLLIDMADAVALARGYIPSSEQLGALDINALLARFADLNTKAGGAQ